MATVKLEPKYLDFSNSLVSLCQDQGIVLTDYAEGLLRLAAETWFEEPPEPHEINAGQRLGNVEMQNLARSILLRALDDPHVRSRMAAKQAVRFNDLLVALADGARKLLEKGF